MSDRPRQLAGESNQPIHTKPRKLVGDNVIALPVQPVESISQQSIIGPLGAAAVVGKTACRGIRVIAARKRNLYDNRPPLVGMRTVFTVDFYDIETREAVSPTSVKITANIGDEEQIVNLVENSGRIGHYSGSFIPGTHGTWTAKLTFGGSNEYLEEVQFYVL